MHELVIHRNRWRVCVAVACLLGLVVVPSCFGCGGRGSEGARCYPNGTCDEGLTCASDRCVRLPGSDAGPDSSVGADASDGGSISDAGACGNDVQESTEDCDGSDLAGADCLSLGKGFVGGTLACSGTCMFDVSACMAPAGCGDGIVGGTEDCDGTNLGGASCAALGFASGTLGCTPGCLFDTDACFTCGDGTIQPAETCDGTNTGAVSCTSLGYGGGTLGCTADCLAVDESGCVGGPPTIPVPRKPMNDSYLGSIYVSGSLRPTFAWEPSSVSGGGAIDYELEYSTDLTFASGVIAATVVTSSTQPATDLAVSMTAPVGARWYWRVRACAMSACSPFSPTWWVNVGRSDRDFNGDGYADVVVGALYEDIPTVGAVGRAYVYLGASGGLDTAPDVVIDGSASASSMGNSVATARDVNGDGFADLLVGASQPGPGSAYLYLGGAGGSFDSVADAVLTGAIDDFNFGNFVSGAGDVNADGFGDILVSAPGSMSIGGRAYLYLGGTGTFDTTADAVLEEPTLPLWLVSVSGAGDTNGDGYADTMVGMTSNGTDLGRAQLYFGGPGAAFDDTADVFFEGMTTNDSMGSAVSAAGDMVSVHG